ncbi:MAG: hypothetical protein PHV37_01030 [Candidatus Gastranaerophilales bacterium]|nr:hypothetical protein [Candidatus Gastranaerophilales bacterium]
MQNLQIYPDNRLDVKNTALYLGVKEKALAQWRYFGKGPPYIKRGRIFYFKEDLDSWLLEYGKQTSTSQNVIQKMKKIEYSINKKMINKTPITGNNNKCFVNQNGTAQKLANAINEGFAFWAKCQQNKTRNKKIFISSEVLVLDFDNGYSLKEAYENNFIKKYATIIYKTPSHTEENNRFRVIFEIELPIKNQEAYENAIRGLLKIFPQADSACSDCSRLFYDSKGSNPEVFEKFIPKEIISELIESGRQSYINKDSKNDSDKENDFDKNIYTKEKIEEMLSYIEQDPGYEYWRNIVWAIASVIKDDEEVYNIIDKWSPDIKNKGKHLRALIKNARKQNSTIRLITFKTLLWEASKRGYKIKIKKSEKIAGHIALKEFLNSGLGYITVGNTLYKYNGNYYKELEENYVITQLTHFFDKWQDNKGEFKFAKPNYVNEAHSYILRKTRISEELINPPGINTKNGYLKISYNENKEAVFELMPHSPELYFTYYSNFEYNPQVSSKYFDEVMNKMLSKEKQAILFRVLASSFDLSEVRKRFSRMVRILLLLGDGSNGKDTVNEWIRQLYAGNGITSIPLQAFKSADKSREFTLAGLAVSKVNWASESSVIALDECKNLINFATGDSMKVEEKYQKPFYIKPKAIGIFNLNTIPYLSSNIEAVLSRFALIKFETIFSSNPKPGQEKADPRLKEDEEFICKEILPSFLNRLIKEFNNLLKEGINYSPVEDGLSAMQYASSHIQRYIEDSEIEECELEEGITETELMLDYCAFSKNQDIMELGVDDTCARVISQNKFDKPITDKTAITERFKKFFPNLKYGKLKNGQRKIGLKIGIKNIVEPNY